MTETTEPGATSEFVDPAQLKTDIAINLATLSVDMQRHASFYVHYAEQSVKARRAVDRYKLAFEILEAQLDEKWRTALKGESGKVTEAQVRSAVIVDPSYRTMSSRLIEAQTEWRMTEVAVSAFDSRKDMLLQVARDAARELPGSMRVGSTEYAAGQASSRRDYLSDLMANTKKAA